MANVDWSMKGSGANNCNCAFGCPCQFNSLPTNGDCRAYTCMKIDEGHFGDVSLNGLKWVMVFDWPQAVHQGNGTCQAIIDENADEKQREALVKILHGQETDPGATYLQVFSTTVTQTHDPVFKPIEMSVDVEGRTASVVVPGIIEASIEPIKNPVSGKESRARIDLPNGFEFRQAEVASGTVKATGAVKLNLEKTHSHLVNYHLTNSGVRA